jgi:hypothetical protein
MVHRNGGPLSRIKRQSHFGWITAEEVARCEAIVREELRLLSGWEGGMASASVDGT